MNVVVYGVPVRLIIPKLAVDTRILPMGLTAQGDMEAPRTNEDAGWYHYSPNPGNKGSAVIDGHRGVTRSAIFTKLSSLQKGDEVRVVDSQGRTSSFTVQTLRTYDKDASAYDVFHSSDGGSHLNLITCNGDYESAGRTYAQRLVVFSDKTVIGS